MRIKIKQVAKKKKGWSLYALAKELCLPQQTVYSWANGRTQPSYDNMESMCAILDCTMSDLFKVEMKPEELEILIDARKATDEYKYRTSKYLRGKSKKA